jgi:hypothetical protein
MERIGSSAHCECRAIATEFGTKFLLELLDPWALSNPPSAQHASHAVSCLGGNVRVKKNDIVVPGLHQGKLVQRLLHR